MSTEDQTPQEQEHLTEEQIALCADAMAMEEFSRITPKMRAHLESCDQCAQEVNETAKIVRQTFSASLSSALMDVQQPKQKNTWWIGVAAGIILILGLGYVFKDQLFIDNNQQLADDTDSTLIIEDTVINIPDNQIAQDANQQAIDTSGMKNDMQDATSAFASNDELESLVERFSSANQRSDELEILTPSNFNTTVNECKLQWKAEEEEYLTVEIFDHTNTKIESLTSSSGEMKPKEIKAQGNYYWKLMNEDFDLLFCGKIVVE